MDFSRKYIKMCEKAKEIQELQPNIQDSLGSYYRYGNFPNDYYEGYEFKSDRFDPQYVFCKKHTDVQEESVWLPRQDQLQEIAMQHKDWVDTRSLNNLALFVDWLDWARFEDDDSLEQIWLIYVMETKFNKTWNGEEWI